MSLCYSNKDSCKVIRFVLEEVFENMEDMLSVTDDTNDFDETINQAESRRKPKKRVKIEEIPSFIQKFTATYFKLKRELISGGKSGIR